MSAARKRKKALQGNDAVSSYLIFRLQLCFRIYHLGTLSVAQNGHLHNQRDLK